MRKLIFTILLLSIVTNVYAIDKYKTKYNSFTSKLDYVNDMTGVENLTATGTISGEIVIQNGWTVVSDTTYGTSWNTQFGTAPSMNAVYDKIETLIAGGGEATTVSDTATIDLTLSSSDITADVIEAGVEAILDLQDLQGAVTDAQVPDNITITETDPKITAGDNLTRTGDDIDLDASISLTNVTASETVTGSVVDISSSGRFTNLTPSVPVLTDANKCLISGALSGTGKTLVTNTNPTITTPTLTSPTMTTPILGTATCTNITASSTVTGAVVDISGNSRFSTLTASMPVLTDANKCLFSGAKTGIGTTLVTNTSPTIVNATLTNPTMTTPTLGTATCTNITASSTVSGAVVDISGNSRFTTLTASKPVFTDANKCLMSRTITYEKSVVIENLAAADDNMSLGMFSDSVTITGVAVSYIGTGTTPATITLEDGSGNAMTITGTNPVAVPHGTNALFSAVTADNTLLAGEILRFDVTNTPDPATDSYTITIKYTINNQ